MTKKNSNTDLPNFNNEDEERDFWATHDSTDYVDWENASAVKLPNLKPSTQTISMRLPLSLLEDLKILAHKRDIPYQSLMKMFLSNAIKNERQSHSQ